MAKDPAFLFYPGDWLGGTMTFTRAQKGAYMDLLMAQFNQFALTSEDIREVLREDYDTMWERKLKAKFETESNGILYYNRKLRDEVLKRKAFTESRRNNIVGNNQYSIGHMTKHKTSHMENENRDENRNEDIVKKEKLFNSIWNKYPNKDGRKSALKHFIASVSTEDDWNDINKALNNYLESERVEKGYVKNGSTWFNNWKDWINVEKEEGIEL